MQVGREAGGGVWGLQLPRSAPSPPTKSPVLCCGLLLHRPTAAAEAAAAAAAAAGALILPSNAPTFSGHGAFEEIAFVALLCFSKNALA